jgi:hypothetical protein
MPTQSFALAMAAQRSEVDHSVMREVLLVCGLVLLDRLRGEAAKNASAPNSVTAVICVIIFLVMTPPLSSRKGANGSAKLFLVPRLPSRLSVGGLATLGWLYLICRDPHSTPFHRHACDMESLGKRERRHVSSRSPRSVRRHLEIQRIVDTIPSPSR